jgi:TetR/AcrR family transcriptional regulator, tetracycline repressor protein
MGDEEEKRSGLSRGRLVAVALDLMQEEGLGALTMRGLADRMGVKAASLYWHVRDRGELVELLAQAVLSEVRVAAPRSGWRAEALAVCSALERVTSRRRDAAPILLEVPDALERSDAHARLRRVLEGAGLPAGEAQEVATMMLVHVLVGATRSPGDDLLDRPGRVASVAIDTGSRGVTLRAGLEMTGLIRSAHDPAAPAPAVVRGDTVIVRRLRGGKHGELELNPGLPWRFRVQAPTWNTVLDLSGIDVRGIHIDSGATRIDCVLPAPAGSVPIEVSSGVVGVRLRRPVGVPVVAEVSTAAVQLRLDAFTIGATTSDVVWESAPGASQADHYRLRINSGTVRVSLEEDPSLSSGRPMPAPPVASNGVVGALNVVLDGVESRRG